MENHYLCLRRSGSSIYILLFVCLYPINVKTIEPIGPNFFYLTCTVLKLFNKLYSKRKYEVQLPKKRAFQNCHFWIVFAYIPELLKFNI